VATGTPTPSQTQDEINIHHSDPNNRDTDGDRVNDGNEVNNEKSNPTSTDTDGDGRDDGQEVDKTDPDNRFD
jgi:hypothetical protein